MGDGGLAAGRRRRLSAPVRPRRAGAFYGHVFLCSPCLFSGGVYCCSRINLTPPPPPTMRQNRARPTTGRCSRCPACPRDCVGRALDRCHGRFAAEHSMDSTVPAALVQGRDVAGRVLPGARGVGAGPTRGRAPACGRSTWADPWCARVCQRVLVACAHADQVCAARCVAAGGVRVVG